MRSWTLPERILSVWDIRVRGTLSPGRKRKLQLVKNQSAGLFNRKIYLELLSISVDANVAT